MPNPFTILLLTSSPLELVTFHNGSFTILQLIVTQVKKQQHKTWKGEIWNYNLYRDVKICVFHLFETIIPKNSTVDFILKYIQYGV